MSGGSEAAAAAKGGGSLIRGIAGFQSGKANARMARAEADGALRQSVAQDDAIRAQARRTAGEAVAAMGATGGGLGSGSALDVLRDIELESGLDRLRVKAEGANKASSLRAQASLYKRQGAWNLMAGVADAATSVLTGGAG